MGSAPNIPVGQTTKDMSQMTDKPMRKGLFSAFIDFFVLFSGISTKSNLERTQRRPLLSRGLFLFRNKKRPEPPGL
jgi:hypothetical protein